MSVPTNRLAAPRKHQAARTRDSETTTTSFGQHSKALALLTVAVVVMAVLPDVVHFLYVKHAPDSVRILAPRVPLERVTTGAAAVALFVVCSVIALGRGHPDRRVPGAIVLLLGLIIPYAISPALPATTDIVEVALAVAVILAVWNIGACVDGLKWVSISGSMFGAYSLVGGLIAPEHANYRSVSTKALIGDWQLVGDWQLAGPFWHSNNLGVYCVLALALSPLIGSVRWRILNGLILCTAIVASASRTALIAAGVLALWWIICRFRSVISIRFAGTALVGLSAAAVLALPLLSWNRLDFTGRGYIWPAGLNAWKESRLFGLGINWFATTAIPASRFESWALLGSAHNIVVDTLVRSGLVGICLLALVLLAAIHSTRALDVSRHQIACFGYLIAFLVASSTEAIWVLLPSWELFPVVGLVFAVMIVARHDVQADATETSTYTFNRRAYKLPPLKYASTKPTQ